MPSFPTRTRTMYRQGMLIGNQTIDSVFSWFNRKRVFEKEILGHFAEFSKLYTRPKGNIFSAMPEEINAFLAYLLLRWLNPVAWRWIRCSSNQHMEKDSLHASLSMNTLEKVLRYFRITKYIYISCHWQEKSSAVQIKLVISNRL